MKKAPMPKFEIKSGIPLKPYGHGGGASYYPFDQLEVGQCFDAPDTHAKAIYTAASRWGRKLGRRFTSRFEEDGTGGRIIRTWRLPDQPSVTIKSGA